MKIKNNKKGFTLVEVLLTLMVIGLISVIVTQLLTFNATSSKAFSLYNKQQYTVQSAFNRLCKDVQAASRIYITDNISGNEYATIQLTISEGASTRTCEYKLLNNKLTYESGGTVQIISDGLTDKSVFVKGNDCLTVVLEHQKDSGKNVMNMAWPIVGEFNLEYKDTN